MEKLQRLIIILVIIALVFSLAAFYLSSSLREYRSALANGNGPSEGGGQIGVTVLPPESAVQAAQP